MKLNVIENQFNCEYASLATIQPNAVIGFKVTGLNDLYFDLNNSRMHMLAINTKANGTNIKANTAAKRT